MIECGYFWGLTSSGFLKEIKLSEAQHQEDSIPKIGDLFVGRYTDDEPTLFTGFSVAFKDNERVFINKDNKIKKIDSEKVNNGLIKSFQSLINQLASLKSKDVSDYSFISKDKHRNIEKDNTSYNIELIKDIEEVYNIKAEKVDIFDISKIKTEMNNILLLSSMLRFPWPENEYKLDKFNRSAIALVATGMTYGNVFNIKDIYESSMGVYFTRDDDESTLPSVYFSDLERSFRAVKVSKNNVVAESAPKNTFKIK